MLPGRPCSRWLAAAHSAQLPPPVLRRRFLLVVSSSVSRTCDDQPVTVKVALPSGVSVHHDAAREGGSTPCFSHRGSPLETVEGQSWNDLNPTYMRMHSPNAAPPLLSPRIISGMERRVSVCTALILFPTGMEGLRAGEWSQGARGGTRGRPSDWKGLGDQVDDGV